MLDNFYGGISILICYLYLTRVDVKFRKTNRYIYIFNLCRVGVEEKTNSVLIKTKLLKENWNLVIKFYVEIRENFLNLTYNQSESHTEGKKIKNKNRKYTLIHLKRNPMFVKS